jgi:GxxExxY protein
LSYKINGLLFKTHNQLGRYKNEKQYADKFERLLKEGNIKYKREFNLPPSFAGENKNRNRVDFLIEDEIIIDFKTKPIITKDDYFQMQRYLDSYGKKLGLIVNFRHKFLKPKRIINSKIELK